jgi:HSP20 family protein
MATQQIQTEQPKKATPAETSSAIERKESGASPIRRSPSFPSFTPMRPFSLMRRLSEDMDRLFEQFWGASPISPERLGGFGEGWWPAIDMYQRDNKLVVQADVPGLAKDDIKVEVRDNQLCISGERKSATERPEGGYYRSERSYGSFSRTIDLPPGAKADTASARFDKGVLEVELELAPQKAPGGRLIEIREGKSN